MRGAGSLLNRAAFARAVLHSGTFWLLIACNGGDTPVRIAAGACRDLPPAHLGEANALAFAPDGKLLYTGSSDGTLKAWEMPAGKLVSTWREDTAGIWAIAMSADGAWLASGSLNAIRLRERGTGRSLAEWPAQEYHQPTIRALAFNPAKRVLLSLSDYPLVQEWELPTGKEISSGVNPVGVAAAFGPGKWEAHGSVAYHADSLAHPVHILQLDEVAPYSLAFHPEGTFLAAGYHRKLVLWSIKDWKPAATYNESPEGISSIAFSPDGRRLAAGAENGTITVWDVVSGKLAFSLKGHADNVMSLAFSPDGSMLASASEDHSVRLWRFPAGEFSACLSDAALRANAALAAGADSAEPGRMAYDGGIGDEAIWMELTEPRPAGAVRGAYEYRKIGKPIALQGERKSDSLHLTESVGGKATGRFDLGISRSFPDSTLHGTWRKPGRKTGHYVFLQSIDPAWKSCAGLGEGELMLESGYGLAHALKDARVSGNYVGEDESQAEVAEPESWRRTYALTACYDGLFATRRTVLDDMRGNVIADLRIFDATRKQEVVILNEIEVNKFPRFLDRFAPSLDSLLRDIRGRNPDSVWMTGIYKSYLEPPPTIGELDTLFRARERSDLRLHLEAGALRLGFGPYLGFRPDEDDNLVVPDEIFIEIAYRDLEPFLRKNSPLRRIGAASRRGALPMTIPQTDP